MSSSLLTLSSKGWTCYSHASQDSCQVWQDHQGDRRGRQEEEEEQVEARVLWLLHLQGAFHNVSIEVEVLCFMLLT